MIAGVLARDAGRVTAALGLMGFVADGRGGAADAAVLALVEGVHERILRGIDPDAFRLGDLTLEYALETHAETFGDMADLGVSVGDLASAFRVPRDWILLERTALLLIGLCTTLDPDANPLRVLRPPHRAARRRRRRGRGGGGPGRGGAEVGARPPRPARPRADPGRERDARREGAGTPCARPTASTPGSARWLTPSRRRARAASPTRRGRAATPASRWGSPASAGCAPSAPSPRRGASGGPLGGRATGAGRTQRTDPKGGPKGRTQRADPYLPAAPPRPRVRPREQPERQEPRRLLHRPRRRRLPRPVGRAGAGGHGPGPELRGAACSCGPRRSGVEGLGGHPARQVFGVELDEAEHARVGSDLRERWLFNGSLVRSDFFDIEPDVLGPVDAVVGNPPFIRFQRFKGAARARATHRALAQGVRLPKMASSWAAFTVHAAALVGRGGRLAFVLPAEIGYTDYALPVLHFLQRSFGALTLVTFRRKLFPDLSESTVLLLADDAGGSADTVRLVDLENADALDGLNLDSQASVSVDALALARRDVRLSEYLLPADSREAYAGVRDDAWALSDLARVGIGYVSGANSFFHLRETEAQERGLPPNVLRPAVLRGRSLDGIAYRTSDWEQARDADEPAYLLDLNRPAPLAPEVEAYLAGGVAGGVPDAYKCRVRTPWYAVPPYPHA